MNGINMFNKKAIKDFVDSRFNSDHLYKDAILQDEFIVNSKKQFEMVDHKQFLETLKEVSILPYI